MPSTPPAPPTGSRRLLSCRGAGRTGGGRALLGSLLIHGALGLVAGSLPPRGGSPDDAHSGALAIAVELAPPLRAERHPTPPPTPALPPTPPPPEPVPPAAQEAPPATPTEPGAPDLAEAEAGSATAEAGEALLGDESDAFSLTTGDGDGYPGGPTAGMGGPGGGPLAPGGSTGGTRGAAPIKPSPADRPRPRVARRPWPENGDWNLCRFPKAAARAGVEDGRATIVVHVSARGRPLSVDVHFETPHGYGFGESARQCAMRRRYHPGADVDGNRIATATDPYHVRMLRHR